MRIIDWSADVCSSDLRFIRFNTELCDPEFMFWYLQYLYSTGSMHAYHTQHTGVARFQWTTFSARELIKLPSRHVQQSIANVLPARSEERRDEHECVSTCIARWQACN